MFSGIKRGVSSFASGFFQTKTSDEFRKLALKVLGDKKLLINLNSNWLEYELDDQSYETKEPLLIYIHKPDHPLANDIIKKVIQNGEFASCVVTKILNKEYAIQNICNSFKQPRDEIITQFCRKGIFTMLFIIKKR